MVAKAIYKYARISPKKCHNVAYNIRNLSAEQAVNILTYTPKKSAFMILNTLKSAIANAENKHEIDVSELIVTKAVVNQGPTFKRFKARARGRGDMIKKRTSHILIELDVKKEDKEKEDKKKTNSKSTKTEIKDTNKVKKKETKASKPKPKPKAIKESKANKSEQTIDENLGKVYSKEPKDKDDLKVISGVAKVIEQKLNKFGVYHYEQIANWNKKNIEEFDKLLSFHGRIEREEWVKQAKELHKNK